MGPKRCPNDIAKGRMVSRQRADVGIDQANDVDFLAAMTAECPENELGMGTDAPACVVSILETADVSENEHG